METLIPSPGSGRLLEAVAEATSRLHHPFSPSTLAALEQCPAYEGRNESSVAAERGTLQHVAVEVGEDDGRLFDHEALAVQDCTDFCRDLIEKKYGGKPGHDLTEPYLPIDRRTIHMGDKEWDGLTAGYCDRALVSQDETFADIIDWKFGSYEVTDAQHNLQGHAYLLGLVRKFPSVVRVTVHFIAPHRDEWSFHTFDFQEYDWLRVRVERIVRKAVDARALTAAGDFSHATPSPSACRFCRHVGSCTALDCKMVELGQKLKPLAFPATLRPDLQSPGDAARGLDLAAVAKTWAEGYRRSITNRSIEQEDFCPAGYTVQSRQNR